MDNSTSDDVQLYKLSMVEVIMLCILYATIALVTIIGNLLVLYIAFTKLRVRSITTYFIINLAFADLLTGTFAIPFKFQAALFQKWFLPESLCTLVPYAEMVSLSVSVFTLTISAIHEFHTVFFPKRSHMSTKRARFWVLVIWFLAALVSLPHGIFHKVHTLIEADNSTTLQCLPTCAHEHWWKMYNVYLTVITYFVPMVILDTAYTMIAVKIWTATQKSADENRTLKQPTPVVSEISNRKLMKMLIIVVFCFTLCWLPLETYLMLNELKPEINSWQYINVMFFCVHALAMSNSCLNPIIYGLFNAKYKREYARIYRLLMCRGWTNGVEESSKFDTETCVGKETEPDPCFTQLEFAPVANGHARANGVGAHGKVKVVQRRWRSSSADDVLYYSETFTIVPRI